MELKQMCFYSIFFITLSSLPVDTVLDEGITMRGECSYLIIGEDQGNAYTTSKGYDCCLCSKGRRFEGDCSGPDHPHDTKCVECRHDEHQKTYIDHDAHKLDTCQIDRCNHPFIPVGGTTENKSRCVCPDGLVKIDIGLGISDCVEDNTKVIEPVIKKVPKENVIITQRTVVTPLPETFFAYTEKMPPSHKKIDDIAKGNKDLLGVTDTHNDHDDDKPPTAGYTESPKFKATSVTSVPPSDGDSDQNNPPGHLFPFGIVIASFVGGIFFIVVILLFVKHWEKFKAILPKIRCSPIGGSTGSNVQTSRVDEVVVMMCAESNSEVNDDRITDGTDAANTTDSRSSVNEQSDDQDNDSDENTAAHGNPETVPLIKTVEDDGTQKNMAVPLENNTNREQMLSNDSRDVAGGFGRLDPQNTVVNLLQSLVDNVPQPPNRYQQDQPRPSTLQKNLRDKAIDRIISTIHPRDLTGLGHWMIPNDNELEHIKERYDKDGPAEVARQVFKRGLQLQPNLSLYDFHSKVKNMDLGYLVDVFKDCINEYER